MQFLWENPSIEVILSLLRVFVKLTGNIDKQIHASGSGILMVLNYLIEL